MKQLTPSQIVKELDRYIIGQNNAKKAVAIALRNRWRRQQVEGKLRNEIMPNNIIMIGSTGVGKTEIARRLASLANAPFIKVEASKFTEVGYVGRDVESITICFADKSVDFNSAFAAACAKPLPDPIETTLLSGSITFPSPAIMKLCVVFITTNIASK